MHNSHCAYSLQSKIDKLITEGNEMMSIERKEEIAALVRYSQAVDIFELMDKYYPIQLHELNVKISLCWNIVDNPKTSLIYLNKAMEIIPNIPTMVIYKSILLQSLNCTDESQKFLLKYKQLGGYNYYQNFYYDTFRLIYYYILQYDDDMILREINDYLLKYKDISNSTVVIYYIRAKMYSNIANRLSNDDARKASVFSKYEESIMKANQIQTSDTNYLIKEDISNYNITKVFFMVLPHMGQYQPKELKEYRKFNGGMGVFFIVFKVIKLFKIKLERKKIKFFYKNQMKILQKNNNAKRNSDSINEINGNTSDDFSVLRKDSDGVYRNMDDIKKEYQISVRNLYKSVWVSGYFKKSTLITEENDFNTKHNSGNSNGYDYIYQNYFDKKGYYDKNNINPLIFQYIAQNEKYKKEEMKRGNDNNNNNNSNSNISNNISNNISTNHNNISNNNNIKIKRIEHVMKVQRGKDIQMSKTPVKLGEHIRMKIKKQLILTNNRNDSNSKGNLSSKSGNLFTINNKKKNMSSAEETSVLSRESQVEKPIKEKKLSFSKFSPNLVKLDAMTVKKKSKNLQINTKLQKLDIVKISSFNPNDKTFKAPRIKNINIRITHINKDKSKEKSKSNDKTKKTLNNKLISCYAAKPQDKTE